MIIASKIAFPKSPNFQRGYGAGPCPRASAKGTPPDPLISILDLRALLQDATRPRVTRGDNLGTRPLLQVDQPQGHPL